MIKPISATLEITLRCNLECLTCFSASTRGHNQPQLATERLLALVDELVAEGVRSIQIGGGEPTMHPGLIELLRRIKSQGATPGFSTNGTLLTPQLCAQIAEAGVNHSVFISIDGPSPETYRKIRVSAAFNSVIRGLRNLREAGIRYAMSAVVVRENQDHLEELYNLAVEEGAEFLNLIRFNLEGRGGENWEELEPTRSFTELVQPLRDAHGGWVGFFGENCMLPAREGLNIQLPEEGDQRRFVSVAATGDVLMGRASAELIIGNILERSFHDVWNSQKTLAIVDRYPAREFISEIERRRSLISEGYRTNSVVHLS